MHTGSTSVKSELLLQSANLFESERGDKRAQSGVPFGVYITFSAILEEMRRRRRLMKSASELQGVTVRTDVVVI
jgi:hypothetical protein